MLGRVGRAVVRLFSAVLCLFRALFLQLFLFHRSHDFVLLALLLLLPETFGFEALLFDLLGSLFPELLLWVPGVAAT